MNDQSCEVYDRLAGLLISKFLFEAGQCLVKYAILICDCVLICCAWPQIRTQSQV